MPEQPKSDLEPTPDGFFRTRLRYGKGLRARFLIKLREDAAAEKRAVPMDEVVERWFREAFERETSRYP